MTNDGRQHEAHPDPRPPSMFSRPTDVPEVLPPIRGSELLSIVHTKWAGAHTPAEVPVTSAWHKLLRRSRRVGARVMGRRDHELLGDLIRAVDAVAARCDDLAARVETLTTNVDDMARAYGEDITQARADLERLREKGSESSRVAAPRDG